MSDVQLGLIGSAFLLVYRLVSLFAGLLAVQWGLRRTILLSLAIWSAVILVRGFVRTGPQLIALRALMGSSEAFYMPAALAFVMLLHGEATRSRATALHQSGNHIGVIVGGTLGGWFAQHGSWRFGFFLLGAIGIIYAGFLGSVFRRLAPPGSVEMPRKLARILAGLRRYRAMLGAFCLYSAAGWIVLAWMPLYLYEKFHMTLSRRGPDEAQKGIPYALHTADYFDIIMAWQFVPPSISPNPCMKLSRSGRKRRARRFGRSFCALLKTPTSRPAKAR